MGLRLQGTDCGLGLRLNGLKWSGTETARDEVDWGIEIRWTHRL